MRESDIEAVLAAERRIYEFPWTRGNFADSLAAGYSSWVCRDADDAVPLAYGVMLLVLDEAHLLNLSVVPERRRQGVGLALLRHFFCVAKAHSAHDMFLEVRQSNLAAMALYESCGFRAIGRRRGYYAAAAGREDAIVMARPL